MADRPFPRGLAWALFLACTLGGAALVLSDRRGLRSLGLALLVAPLAAFLALQFAYYLLDRRHAGRP